jgi:DNA repair protein RecN (Recombination protein N)
LLAYLKVRDFALIDELEVEFGEGLNVLTGETGAGKTVLVEAIGLLLGDRADTLQVRHGAEEAVLECCFTLEGADERRWFSEMGYIEDGEGEIAISRRIGRGGRSRCSVNARLCPVSALAGIGERLVEVHGQNAHQMLLRPPTHLEYLDRFAGGEHLETLRDYRKHYRRLSELRKEREGLRAVGSPAGEIEILRYEIEQISKAQLRPGELESLEAEACRLRNTRELSDLATGVVRACSNEDASPDARGLLAVALQDLRRMSATDDVVRGLADRLQSLMLELEDLSGEVASYREGLHEDQGRLLEVESRMSFLRELCRRYGGNIVAVISYLDEASGRLTRLSEAEERHHEIGAQIEEAVSACETLSGALHLGRLEAAEMFAGRVVEQLKNLELPGAEFIVKLEDRSQAGFEEGDRFGPDGTTTGEFLFSPVEGEPPKPLKKIASGGEMSRVMLAIKMVLAAADNVPCLIFDEVDSGIGGRTAGAVGEKLFALTEFHQVLCVTHLPQIATFADRQYGVRKEESPGSGRTGILLLDDEARVEEICRMLGGSTERKVTRDHAADMLKRAGGKKASRNKTWVETT